MTKHIRLGGILCLLASSACVAQEQVAIPPMHTNVHHADDGRLYIEWQGNRLYEVDRPPRYTLENAKGNPVGTDEGIAFDFADESLNGILYAGLISYEDAKYPLPVYRPRIRIQNGRTEIKILDVFSGRYDMTGWAESGKGTIGYRVTNDAGRVIYDGKVSFRGTGPFEVDATLIEGPFVNLLTPEGATISFETNDELVARVEVNGQSFSEDVPTRFHEIAVTGLDAATEYGYSVHYGDNTETYSFQTAPESGARSSFVFSYASDSRSGQGGGERDIYGANAYIMKRIMALNALREVVFMQFSGDLINGYLQHRGDMDLQYANWKRAIEPFARYFPVIAGMGNHEAFTRGFTTDRGMVQLDRFPYDTESSETVFAHHFVNPMNGPTSEDGAVYDPNPDVVDFPTYKENVFYYTYDNVAMVVMNSDYWYMPTTPAIPLTGGGLHGYIMDQQLVWFEETIAQLEADSAIDHIFVTQHTPFFPNGGHVGDDMWYRGDNTYRPWVNGQRVDKGIIERRDQLLDIIVNKSTKVIAILTGDEHNYNRLEVGPETNIYPENWALPRLELSRTIYQVNNGAAGAPYYAQEETPWTPFVSSFTTQNALVLFHVEGTSLKMEVQNPDTLEPVDYLEMR